ncbi:carboxymethylcellulase [Dioszegia hungarica]|uniref:cellulase n=1 Tax=Dioszegia hungarica TaxID=4972 RepID=A0AA38LU24_9TREE|nr:carboxymethylcellulase [Dioszegia hungarica]KAI9633316.1 carboxymethylcellulase [Dioszegia hungarica]
MLLASLFPVLAFLSGTIAVPLNSRSIEKRALPKLGGVNLAGCDFGMNTNGNSGTSYCPGTDQIAHFTKQGANLIRLPVGWQYLTANSQTSTSFDETFFAIYDKLVQASLAAGAYVMIDVHNYARWNGGIIGQGGPSNADFANLWSNLAKRYATEPRIIFGIMNEPHDLDMPKWGATVQAAVNAIRAAGATSQSIALPGTLYTHAELWYQGVNDPVVAVTDPASSDKSKLIIDVHQYLDSDGSGTSRECVINAVDKMKLLSAWLKTNGRKAIVSEIGGGNTASCQTNLGQFLSYVASDSNFIGFAAWSAGSFDSSYELSITPQNGQDNDLFKKAILPYLPG